MSSAKMAPDGGPLSNATVQGVRRHELLRVRDTVTGGECLIRDRDYDPKRHTRIVEQVEPAPAPRKRKVIADEPPTEEELGALSSKRLKKIPEYEALDEPRPTRKADIVKAILAAREE